MREEDFVVLCSNIVERIRNVAPIDTGNLRYNAIRYEFVDEKTCKIYVDESIAPYMKYTNESWDNFAPPLQGKKNPNEKWWENKALPSVVRAIEELLADKFIKSENNK